MLKATENGSVDLYYNNNVTIQTADVGAIIKDADTNVTLRFETTAGQAGNITGIDDDNLIIQDNTGKDWLNMHKDGQVEIYHNGTKKLETHANGVHMSGSLYVPDSQIVGFGDTSNPDLRIYHNGSHTYLDNKVGHLYLRNHETNSNNIYATVKEGGEFGAFKNGTSEWLIKTAAGGSTELWYDGSKKFETTSTGATLTGNLGIGTTSPNNAIHLKGTDPVIEMEDTAGGDRQGIFVSDGGYLGFYNFTDGRVDMAIDGTGKVGIGTTSPVGKLTVNSGNITLSDGYGFTNGADADKTFMAGTSGSSGHLAFGVNNTERIRINSAGQILSGMTSANVGDANAIFAGGGNAGSGNYGKIYLSANYTNPAADIALSFIGTSTNNVSNNAMAFIGVHADGQHASNNYPTRFGFFTNTGTSSATEKVRIHNSGEVTIPAGITLGTAVTSKASSNTLDDYEEGVWTPVLQAFDGSAWQNVTYDNGLDYSQGNYIKIGSLVFIYYYSGNFDLASGFNTQYARINGLPFVFRNASPYYGGAFTFTHTNCFKNLNNDLFDCHGGYGVYSQNYINPSIGNSANQAKWGSESNRYMMVAGTYQTTT